jgi:hypothetical protein
MLWAVPVSASHWSRPVGGGAVTESLDQLWHYGTWRCVMSPHDVAPPFRVTVYENDTVI